MQVSNTIDSFDQTLRLYQKPDTNISITCWSKPFSWCHSNMDLLK